MPVTSAGGAGPSPRVRGKRPARAESGARRRSIPARAGKARATSAAPPMTTVHPRACGESQLAAAADMLIDGPSPRVRGKPHCSSARWWPSWVHPRACGESEAVLDRAARLTGPSPRVRGKPCDPGRVYASVGSIPARAGKATGTRFHRRATSVHPRACGESGSLTRWQRSVPGPSPRVRGKRPARAGSGARRRSIPARAGKAPSSRCPSSGGAVHPRACGESGCNWPPAR